MTVSGKTEETRTMNEKDTRTTIKLNQAMARIADRIMAEIAAADGPTAAVEVAMHFWDEQHPDPTEFRVDGELFNMNDDRVIEYMILEERGGGMIEKLLLRKRGKRGYVYANVTWDLNAGQLSSGKWFSKGRSVDSAEYVVDHWRLKP
jgi:hypothetical protein